MLRCNFVERENMGKSHVINLIINSVRACFVLFGLLAYWRTVLCCASLLVYSYILTVLFYLHTSIFFGGSRLKDHANNNRGHEDTSE